MADQDALAQQQLRMLQRLLIGAVAAAVVSAIAGLILLAIDPEPSDGFGLEGALGIVAAIAGLLTGVLAIAAVIYAQVKNLWRLAPTWVRGLAWAVIAFGVAYTLWNLISQPFAD